MGKENFFSGIDFNISDYKFQAFKVPEDDSEDPKGYEFKDLKNVIKREDLISEEVLNKERKISFLILIFMLLSLSSELKSIVSVYHIFNLDNICFGPAISTLSGISLKFML